MFGFLKRKKFGQIAVEKGLATEKDIQEALKEQKEWARQHKIQKKIGAILTEKKILTPDDVKMILEEQKSQMSLMAWFAALFGMSR